MHSDILVPDIGSRYVQISGPISGYTYIGTKCHNIGSFRFTISHTMSLRLQGVPSRPRAQGRGWLSCCQCCRLLVMIRVAQARESFIQCNDLYFFFPAAAAAPAATAAGRWRQQRQRPQRRWRPGGRLGRRWRVGKCLVVHRDNVQFCKPLVVLA
jgi:hypothetical protein